MIRLSKISCPRTRQVVFGLVAVFSSAALFHPGIAKVSWGDDFDPEGAPGAVILCGGGDLPAEIRQRFIDLAGGKQARLVVIPTANVRSDAMSQFEAFVAPWKQLEPQSVQILHASSRLDSEKAELVNTLREATGVWFSGGVQSRLSERYLDTPIEAEIQAVRARGGVVGGTSAGAAIMTRVMIADGFTKPQIDRGFDVFPDAIVDQHFTQRNRWQRLVAAVALNPKRVGVGIDERTALVVQGRRAEVLGSGQVTLCLCSDAQGKSRVREFQAGQIVDVTSWRRAARNAVTDEKIMLEPPTPRLSSGALLFAGDGELPEPAIKRFLDLAGGTDSPIVILRAEANEPDRDPFTRAVQPFNLPKLVVLEPKRKADIDQPETLRLLSEAKAVWFSAGQKWKWIDLLDGTDGLTLIRQVLDRGGVIGAEASSSSIQCEFLVRADPMGTPDAMALGYEHGLGFFPGTAVTCQANDQGSFDDLLTLVKRFPRMQGVGIDNSTALIIQGSTGEVHGNGSIHVCDGGPDLAAVANLDGPYAMPNSVVNQPVVWHRVDSGQRYDFQNRRVLLADAEATQE